MTKNVFMIAGPNGAGKTTTAIPLIQNAVIHEFLNADEIARGLAPLHPESVSLSASKLMLLRLDELLTTNKSFAFETTAAGTNYVKHLNRAREQGYKIHLLFLWLSSADIAVKRVAKRVSLGGHNIPEDIVRRRYLSGLRNLIKHYLPLSDSALILDNSLNESNKVIAIKNDVKGLIIEETTIWEEIERIADANTKT